MTVAKAFKADLACWSDYFRKLFSNEFKDSKGTEVCVEDVDPAVLGLVIRAMYERKVRSLCPPPNELIYTLSVR